MKKDLYQTVTDTIIKDLEFGIRPWMQPWIVGAEGSQLNRPLHANGEAYRGINVLSCGEQPPRMAFHRRRG